MRVTLTHAVQREHVYYDIDPSMDVGLLIVMAAMDLGVQAEGLTLLKGHQCIAGLEDREKSLMEVGVVEGDILVLVPEEMRNATVKREMQRAKEKHRESRAENYEEGTVASSSAASASVGGSTVPMAADQELIKLIQSIKIPKYLTDPVNVAVKKVYDKLKAGDKTTMSQLFFQNKPLYEEFTKGHMDYETFLARFREQSARLEREKKLKADPNSEEGQRLIQADIAKERILHMYEHAMEHRPEFMVRTHMLYINMRINGVLIKAFVDSGAQVSVMSSGCARRCNLNDVIDQNFRSTARGVGGIEQIIGRIHTCPVQVEDHFFECPFEVMADREVDLLLGLNVLRILRCTIDLKNDRLVMGDGTVTSFLKEGQVMELLEEIKQRHEAQFDVNEAYKTTLINQGYKPEKVIEALTVTRNNLELAKQLLDENPNAREFP